MQRFDENTLLGLYILNLLYNYHLPKIRVLSSYLSDPEANINETFEFASSTYSDNNGSCEYGYTFTPFDNELYVWKNTVRRHTEGNSTPELDVIVHAYTPGKNYQNLTDIYYSNTNYYDSKLHEHLGNYLRFYRDYYNINLMSMYNCFSNTYIDKFSLPIVNNIASTKNSNMKLISIPVKFGKQYKIYCDSPSANNLIQLAFYDNNQLLKLMLKEGQLTGIDTNKLYACNLSFSHAYSLNVDNAKSKEEQSFEKYLKLFILIPSSANSSIVVIEHDPHINDFCLNPSLLYKNYYSQHAFADRLFEFILGTAITPLDPITHNIVKIQQIISSDKFRELYGRQFSEGYSLGEFNTSMHKFIYNTFRDIHVFYDSDKSELVRDFTGYVDKDVEDLILRAEGKSSSLYDRSSS